MSNYQTVGTNFLFETRRCGLGDDPGLGKTKQVLDAILLVEQELNRQPHGLVVVPNGIKNVWATEITKWTPNYTYTVVEGKKGQRVESIQNDSTFTIINYDLMGSRNIYKVIDEVKTLVGVNKMHQKDLATQPYDFIIFDEAHRLRGRSSAIFGGAKHVCKQSNPRWLWFLSGTFIVNSGADMWPILHLINPELYKGFWNWAKERFQIGNRYSDWAVGDLLNPAALKDELTPYILRREKKDVLTELLPVTYTNVEIDLTSEQQKLYTQMKKKKFVEYKGQLVEAKNALVVVNKLKQICVGLETLLPNPDVLSGPKVEALFDILDSLGNEKVVIFSQYARVVRGLLPLLRKKYGKFASFTGEDDTDFRKEQEDLFRTPDCKGLLLTMGVGSEGGTYTEANHAIFMDLWWTPATNKQAVGRIDRKGQLLPCTIWSLIAKNSIEQKIIEMLGKKEALFDDSIPLSRVTELINDYIENVE